MSSDTATHRLAVLAAGVVWLAYNIKQKLAQPSEKKQESEKKQDSVTLDPLRDVIMDEQLARNEYPSNMLDVYKAAHARGEHCSYMAQNVTPEMFAKYKDLKSGGLGNWTMARAMNTGMKFPRAFTGAHAGDPESYDTFVDLYKPIIESYHEGFKMDEMKHVTDLNPANVVGDISKEAQKMIVSSRIRVARNLAAPFTMNPNGTAETRLAVLNLVRQFTQALPEDLKGTLHVHAEMSAEKEQKLIDDHVLFKGKDARQAACGYHQHWPHGRGVFQSTDLKENFAMWVNEGDHLRIMCLFRDSADIKAVLGKLQRGVREVEKAVKKVTGSDENPWAVHPVLGCITCCPSNLGTGCRASVMMLLPTLVSTIGLEGIEKICEENKCQARGSSGEYSEVNASNPKIDISNKYRLGHSEAQLVSYMIACCNKLATMENQAKAQATSATEN